MPRPIPSAVVPDFSMPLFLQSLITNPAGATIDPQTLLANFNSPAFGPPLRRIMMGLADTYGVPTGVQWDRMMRGEPPITPEELGAVNVTAETQQQPGPVRVQVGEQLVMPPIASLLSAMQERRQAAREAAMAGLSALLEGVPKMYPSGLRYFPGFEPGGVADVALGFITGEGPQPSRIPEALRSPQTVPVPASLLEAIAAPEPGIEADFGLARRLAQQILSSALRIPQYAVMSPQAPAEQETSNLSEAERILMEKGINVG